MFKDLYLVFKNKAIILLFVAIFSLNALGIGFDFYEMFWWYDVLLHFSGGVLIALVVINWPKFDKQFFTKKQKIIFILMVVLIIGLACEIMEQIIQGLLYISYYEGMILKQLNAGITPDSFSDLMMDFIGGFVASFFFLKKK